MEIVGLFIEKIHPNIVLQCQASKTLAFKWFHDWKKFRKIQPDKTYAQVFQLGKKVKQSCVNSNPKQNNFMTKKVSRIVDVKKNSTKVQNKRPVQHQANQVKVLGSRNSVAGIAKVSDSYAQVQLRNTFQVLQDTLDHASFDDHGCQKF